MKGKYGKRENNNPNSQFYTDEVYAKQFIDKTQQLCGDLQQFSLIIEPSAGTGAFLKHLPTINSIGYDIDPKAKSIIRQNFFDVGYEKGNILVIGNPPFGKVSSLAVKFFNHSANFANVIAFIVPQTFQRTSVQNRLNLYFHLLHNEDIDGCIFTPKMAAKCCFQIWVRKAEARQPTKLPTVHKHWEFLNWGPLDKNNQPTPPEGASFALRAYGAKIGEIETENLQLLRPKSWHWIKTTNKKELIQRFSQLDYSIAYKTARQNSIGRGELVKLYSDCFTV
jgi:hypothetical protein